MSESDYGTPTFAIHLFTILCPAYSTAQSLHMACSKEVTLCKENKNLKLQIIKEKQNFLWVRKSGASHLPASRIT